MKLNLPRMRVQCPDSSVAEWLRRVKWLGFCFEDLLLGLGCLIDPHSCSSLEASLLPHFNHNILAIHQPVTLADSCSQVAHSNQDSTWRAPVQAFHTRPPSVYLMRLTPQKL
jgi:hypothetical protein